MSDHALQRHAYGSGTFTGRDAVVAGVGNLAIGIIVIGALYFARETFVPLAPTHRRVRRLSPTAELGDRPSESGTE